MKSRKPTQTCTKPSKGTKTPRKRATLPSAEGTPPSPSYGSRPEPLQPPPLGSATLKVKDLLTVLMGAWILFAALTYHVEAGSVFHVLDALACASAFIVVLAFWPALRDAWRERRNHIAAAHLLTIAIVSNQIGLMVRLSRWYFTSSAPVMAHEPNAATMQWLYNIGLWVTICALWCHLWALAREACWPRDRVVRTVAAFVLIAVGLFMLDALYP